MRPLSIRQKAQLALLVIWMAAGILVMAARAARPDAAAVLRYLQAHRGDHARLAWELPLRLSRLGFTEQEQVMENPDFSEAVHAFNSDEMRAFLSVMLPQGINGMLTEIRAEPENNREASMRQALDQFRRQAPPGDARVSAPLLKELTRRGIGIYEDEAAAEDRDAMRPYIEQLSSDLAWL